MKPPRYIDSPELWWDDWYDYPVVVYPSGRAEFFRSNFMGIGYWEEDPAMDWADRVVLLSDRFKFLSVIR